MQHLYAAYLLATLALGVLTLSGAVLAAYKWGKFTGDRALAFGSPKWQVYVTAVLPAGAFAAALLFDVQLAAFAFQAFAGLSAPAVIGAGFGFNQPHTALL